MPDAFELLRRVRQTFVSQLDDDGTLFGVHVKFDLLRHFYYTGTVYLSQEHTPKTNSKRGSSTPKHSGSAQGTVSNASGSEHVDTRLSAGGTAFFL